jgi:hypothetical protein
LALQLPSKLGSCGATSNFEELPDVIEAKGQEVAEAIAALRAMTKAS